MFVNSGPQFGDNCNRYPNCGFKHSKGAPKGNKSNKGSKGGKGAGSQAAKCLGVGCPDKGSKGKKLCTTCFMKACEEGELKLKDGTVVTASKEAKEGLNKSKRQTLKKAFAAVIEEEENDSEDEENAPSGVGGPACSAGKKRKRAASAQAANDASKRIKDFAEGLGIDLN